MHDCWLARDWQGAFRSCRGLPVDDGSGDDVIMLEWLSWFCWSLPVGVHVSLL